MPAITADGTLPTGYAPSSNYYIKAVGCDPGSLEQRLASLDLAGLAQHAVCPSLSKQDLIGAYVAAHGQLEAPRRRTVARGDRSERVISAALPRRNSQRRSAS